jgi:anthranilate synthase component II
MILLIDNYDSFVHNLARYFQRLGQETLVVRNDALSVAEIRRLAPQAVVLSPGPCTPTEAGCSVELVREMYRDVPILGVCLGHQAIAAAFGARIVPAIEPMHGRTSSVMHDKSHLFTAVPSPFTVCRYHSLVVEEASLPAELVVTAYTSDGTIMALEHREFPLVGFQFHPEATLTEYGYQLVSNFLELAGITPTPPIDSLSTTEFQFAAAAKIQLPSRPVTF